MQHLIHVSADNYADIDDKDWQVLFGNALHWHMSLRSRAKESEEGVPICGEAILP